MTRPDAHRRPRQLRLDVPARRVAPLRRPRPRRRGRGHRPDRRRRPRRDGTAHRELRVGQVPGAARSAVVRAADRARRDRGGHDAGAARDRHPDRAAAAGRVAREAGGDARRDVAGPPRPRRRHRLAARGVRRGGPRLRRSAGSCSTTRSPRARCCGATRRPRSTRRRCRSTTSTASPSRCSRAACRCGSAARCTRATSTGIVRVGRRVDPDHGRDARRHRRRRAADRATRGRPRAAIPAVLQVQAPLRDRAGRRRPARPRAQHGAGRPSWWPRARPTCT